MAEAIKNIRIQEVKELLAKHKVQFLNDLNYSGLREVLYQTQQRLQSLHSFYYSRDSRFLIREMLGEGGNCVAIALLHLSVLSAVLGEGDWQLGLVFKPSTDAKKTPEPTPESTPVLPPTPPIKNRLHIHQ